ncbi:MAG: hypothetical protein ACLFVQ_14175 [Chitinispirillaceae bacterium]
MKKQIVSVFLTGALMCLAGCSSFPTVYDRIDSDEFRLLDFMYEPAEAAPGDTVTLRAVFAGKSIKSVDNIDWRLSCQVMVNEYGRDTAYDYRPLEKEPVSYSFSDNTQSVAFKFKIPDNAISNSDAIPDNWVELVPNHLRNELPEELTSLSKTDLINLIELCAEGNVPFDPAIQDILPAMLQFLTVRVRIRANVPGEHAIVSNYSVRYNSRFASQYQVPVNRNPVIDSAGVYKVKGNNLVVFDSTLEHEFIRLYGPDEGGEDTSTLFIENGYTYFMAAFTNNVDSTLSMEAATGNAGWMKESHNTLWYYHLDPEETDGVSHTKYMNIVNDNALIVQLLPPLDRRITRFTVWLEVNDSVLNEMFRPRGSALKEYYCKFEYAAEYFDSSSQ